MKSVLLIVSVVVLVFLSNPAEAQQRPGQLHYAGSASLGMLLGESASALQVQTEHGIQYRQWQAGLGIAFDNYRYRTIPLFLDIRRMLPLKTNSLFVYAAGGPDFLWLTTAQKQELSITSQTKFHTGWYGDFGAGYRIGRSKNRNALLLSAGYSVKSLRTTTRDFTPIAYDAPPVFSDRTYTLGRIVVKLGISF